MIIRSKRTPTAGVYDEGDKTIVQHVLPIGDLLSENYELRKDPRKGWDKNKERKLEARFDPITWHSLCQLHPEIQGGDAELRTKTIRKILNDPNFSDFRVSNTRA
jgi:hypothetical protein